MAVSPRTQRHAADVGSRAGLGSIGAALLGAIAALLDPIIGALFALPHLSVFRERERRWDTPRRRRRGTTILLGGIEGPSLAQHGVAAGLLRGGWRGAIVNFGWNAGVPLLRVAKNLASPAHHESAAARLAALIRARLAGGAGRPVQVVAISGGCWVVVKALEQLSLAESVDAVVFLHPAFSRRADLSAAAARCRGAMHLLRSPLDFVMLGFFTTVLGAADRRFGPCAGFLGPIAPPANVRSMAWRPPWTRLGHLGGHCTAVVPAFTRAYIAPLLVRVAATEPGDFAGRGVERRR